MYFLLAAESNLTTPYLTAKLCVTCIDCSICGQPLRPPPFGTSGALGGTEWLARGEPNRVQDYGTVDQAVGYVVGSWSSTRELAMVFTQSLSQFVSRTTPSRLPQLPAHGYLPSRRSLAKNTARAATPTRQLSSSHTATATT